MGPTDRTSLAGHAVVTSVSGIPAYDRRLAACGAIFVVGSLTQPGVATSMGYLPPWR